MKKILTLILFTLGLEVFGHPVTYKNGFEISGVNMSAIRDYQATYSFTSHLASGTRYVYFPLTKQTLYLGQGSWLIKKFLFDEAQGNIYTTLGGGRSYENDESKGVFTTGLEADFETRRIYTSLKFSGFHAASYDYQMVQGRVGFAPYVTGFDGIHTWFMVQGMTLRNQENKVEITPMLRFFYQNVLWEVGASTRGNMMFNFMVHY